MKKVSKIILSFIIVGIIPAAVLGEFSAYAGLAWVFALVIGQGFGQLLAPYYHDGKVPSIGEKE